jgi:hypothetical protein
VQHLDGQELAQKLLDLIDSYKFDEQIATYTSLNQLQDDISAISNTTDICSTMNTTGVDDATSLSAFMQLTYDFYGALFVADGAEEISPSEDPTQLLYSSMNPVYVYFWASTLVVLISSMIMLRLIRRFKADVFDFISMFTRGFMAAGVIALIAIKVTPEAHIKYLFSIAMLPTLCAILFVIICGDRIGRLLSVRRALHKARNSNEVRNDSSSDSKGGYVQVENEVLQ